MTKNNFKLMGFYTLLTIVVILLIYLFMYNEQCTYEVCLDDKAIEKQDKTLEKFYDDRYLKGI